MAQIGRSHAFRSDLHVIRFERNETSVTCCYAYADPHITRIARAHRAEAYEEACYETTINPAMRAECSHHSCAASPEKGWVCNRMAGSSAERE